MSIDSGTAVAWFGRARASIGLALFLFPELAGRIWLGRATQLPPTKTALRAVGGRDLAIGLGMVSAAKRGGSIPRWLIAGSIADSADAVATLMSYRDLPARRRLAIVLTAALAVGGQLGLLMSATRMGHDS